MPGRLRVCLTGDELHVANTGAPLDADGVAALASLRASAKRDGDSVGRFGVGFAAVLGLSDAPRVVSAAGGVAFSAARTADAVAGLPGPAAELARRAGQLPVLRLAWPVGPDEPPVPDGYDTEVRLPLRADVDPRALLDGAREEAAELLLALPGLVEIVVGATVLRRADGVAAAGEVTVDMDGHRTRWRLARCSGVLDAVDAATLAVEQRGRTGWSVCWALPLTADGRPAPLPEGEPGEVLHAPTATTERLSLPARLFATVPLDPDRRHVRAGPATRHVLAAAASAYVDLVRAVDPLDRLALVPAAGFPRSQTDGLLRDLVLDALRGAAWLPGAQGTDVAPGRAEWLDLAGAEGPGLADLLARSGAFPGLLITPDRPPAALGVERLAPAALADRLLGVEMAPQWWHAVYEGLAPAADTVPGLLDELRALPVPLMGADPAAATEVSPAGPELRMRTSDPTLDDHEPGDGEWTGARAARTVPGPASVLLPTPSGAVAAVAALELPGLYVAHPAAAHPLLERLGAAPADPGALLVHPAVAAAVERSVDDAEAGLDPAPLAAAVLALVAEAGAGEIAALALPDAEGGVARADELLLPDAALRPLLADDVGLGVLDPDWAARFPRAVLTAAGVVDGFAVVVDEDPAGPDHDLDGEERWWDGLADPPSRLVAVRDLDLVADDAWPPALALLAGDRETRAAVLAPSGYTAWWLARYARLDGHRPGHWRLPAATALAALYDPVPLLDVDEAFLAAIGVRATLDVADAGAAADLLARLADPGRRPGPALVASAHEALAVAVLDGVLDPADLEPPRHVRALDGAVADSGVAVVLDLPWLAAVLPPGEVVAGGDAAALAELLDLPLASEIVAATVVGAGRPVAWADLAEVVLACQVLGVDPPDGDVQLHDPLVIDVARPEVRRQEVPAWRDGDGRWHAGDPLRALLGVLADPSADDPR